MIARLPMGWVVELKRLTVEVEAARRRVEAERAAGGLDDRTVAAYERATMALRLALELVRDVEPARPSSRRGLIAADSSVGRVVALLRHHGRPLHIDRIVAELNVGSKKKVTRGGLSSRLAKLVRESRIFFQAAPATFGLLAQAEKDAEFEEAAQRYFRDHPEEGADRVREMIAQTFPAERSDDARPGLDEQKEILKRRGDLK